MKSKKWDSLKIKKELDLWVANLNNRELMLEEPMEAVDAYRGGDPAIVITNLIWLSTWHINRGISLVLNNAIEGWHDIGAAAQQYYWQIRLTKDWNYSLKDQEARPTLLLNDTALALALAMSLSLAEEASFIGDTLIDGLSRGLFESDDESHLVPFMLQLYCAFKDISTPTSKDISPDLGAYWHLIANWRANELEFQSSVAIACDFHTERSVDSNSRESFEFNRLAYRIFPVEILAAIRARTALGYPLPDVRHPILDSPLSRPPVWHTQKLEPPIQIAIDRVQHELAGRPTQ